MSKANRIIREALNEYNVRQWELAERFGYSSYYFSVLMRKEFSEEKTLEALSYIVAIDEDRKRGEKEA